jgi:hypothetical protein
VTVAIFLVDLRECRLSILERHAQKFCMDFLFLMAVLLVNKNRQLELSSIG